MTKEACRITEWHGDARGRRLWIGQLCWMRVREVTERVIGEIVELDVGYVQGDDGRLVPQLVRVMLWSRALRCTFPRRPRDLEPVDPRPRARLLPPPGEEVIT